MKDHRIISSAVLLLVLSITLPVFAQREEEKGGGEKAQPAQQHQAQPQHQQSTQRQHQAEPQRQVQTQRQAQPPRVQAQQPARQQVHTAAYNGNRGGGQYGRISNASYGSHFGHDHHFQMGRPQFVGGYNRFQYGGYSFGYNQAWPAGWGYNDNLYVVYEGGDYYMYDLMHPGIHISLNIF